MGKTGCKLFKTNKIFFEKPFSSLPKTPGFDHNFEFHGGGISPLNSTLVVVLGSRCIEEVVVSNIKMFNLLYFLKIHTLTLIISHHRCPIIDRNF